MATPEQLAFDNSLFVQQLDQALINAHLPPDILRTLIDKVNKELTCDADCQRQREIMSLYDKMIKAEQLAQTAKVQASEARKAFLNSEKNNISNTQEGFDTSCL